jgi:hypothetical protein
MRIGIVAGTEDCVRTIYSHIHKDQSRRSKSDRGRFCALDLQPACRSSHRSLANDRFAYSSQYTTNQRSSIGKSIHATFFKTIPDSTDEFFLPY